MAKLGDAEEQALRKLASEIGAEFVKTKCPYAWLPIPYIRVVKKARKWTITLEAMETYPFSVGHTGGSTIVTRITAPYVTKDGFWFHIQRNTVPMRLLTNLLRKKTVQVGDPDFDCEFIVTGSDEAKVWALCANPTIRRLVQRETHFPRVFQPKSHGRAVGVDILLLDYAADHLSDVRGLKCLFELFEEILNQLYQIGSASEDEPDLDSIPASDRRRFGI